MQRFNKFVDLRRADFWHDYYSSPELMSLFAYINQILASKICGFNLLSSYDIVDIGEHNPGNTVTWQVLSPVFVSDTGVIGTYRYKYTVDESWLTMDTIANSHINPTLILESGIDYLYSNGVLKSAVKLDDYLVLYVTKGQQIAHRLADYVGTAFGYDRPDSFKYRDNMITMLKLFYDGPTLANLISAIHVVINSPVTKYSTETVLSTANESVLTDKYKYDLGGAEVAVQIGDVVSQGEPLADAVEIYTNKTHPGWWKDRIPSLFGKYRPSAPLSYAEVNTLMTTFLKLYVAHVRINLRKIDNSSFSFADDIWNLVLDGSPIRTDYIVSAYRLDEELFIPVMQDGLNKLAIKAFCVWGNTDINSEGWTYAPSVVTPYIFEDSVVDPYWKIGSHRWHILDSGKQVDEFWSATDTIMPYFEPTHDYWHIVVGTTTNLPTQTKRSETIISNTEFREMLWDGWYMLGIDPNNTESDPGRPLDNITDSINAIQTGDNNHLTNKVITELVGNDKPAGELINLIYAEMSIAHAELSLWALTGATVLGAAGIVVHKDSTFSVYSPAIFVGCASKTITFTLYNDIPDNTSISYYYSYDNNEDPTRRSWLPLTTNKLVNGNFSNGTYGWELMSEWGSSISNATLSITDNICTMSTPLGSYGSKLYTYTSLSTSHKLCGMCKYKSSSTVYFSMRPHSPLTAGWGSNTHQLDDGWVLAVCYWPDITWNGGVCMVLSTHSSGEAVSVQCKDFLLIDVTVTGEENSTEEELIAKYSNYYTDLQSDSHAVVIDNMTNNVYLKVTLQASPVSYPTFKGLDISIKCPSAQQ